MTVDSAPLRMRSRLATRLIIFALVCLVLAINAPSFIARYLHRELVSLLRSDAAVEKLALNPLTGELTVSRIAVADPDDTTRNLLQFERADLQVSVWSLWHRQLRVERGQIHGLQFGTPRRAGAGPTLPAPAASRPWAPASLGSTAGILSRDAGQRWLDTSAPLPAAFDDAALERARQSSDRLYTEWEARFDQWTARIGQLDEESRQIRDQLQAPHPNPLRDVKHWSAIQQRLAAAREQAQSLRDEVEAARLALPDLAQQIAESFRPTAAPAIGERSPVDPNLLAELLHRHELEGWVHSVLARIAEVRESLPRLTTEPLVTAAEGRQIIFHGQQPAAGLVVESVDVEGSFHIGDERLQFAGAIQQLSSRPADHQQPVSFQFRAQGDSHWVISGTCDRRQGLRTDSLVIRCPNVEWPELYLGDQQTVLIQAAPRRMQLALCVTFHDEELTGHVSLVSMDVALHVDHLHPDLGGAALSERLNQRLGQVNQFATHVAISGQVDRPVLTYRSELAERLAQETVAAQALVWQDLSQQRHAMLEQSALESVDRLNLLFAQRLSALYQQLDAHSTTVTELAAQIPLAAEGIRRR